MVGMTRVLLAEPDSAARLYLQLTLRDVGHDVIAVSTLRDALAATTTGIFDVAYVSDGFASAAAVELIATIKNYELGARTCFVVLSDDELVEAELEIAAVDALVLPSWPSVGQVLWVAHAAGLLADDAELPPARVS